MKWIVKTALYSFLIGFVFLVGFAFGMIAEKMGFSQKEIIQKIETCKTLRKGMTLAEVEAVMGRPLYITSRLTVGYDLGHISSGNPEFRFDFTNNKLEEVISCGVSG